MVFILVPTLSSEFAKPNVLFSSCGWKNEISLLSETHSHTDLCHLLSSSASAVLHPGITRRAPNPERPQPALSVRLLRVRYLRKPASRPSGHDRGELPTSAQRVRATDQGALPLEEDPGRDGAEDRHAETHINCQVLSDPSESSV